MKIVEIDVNLSDFYTTDYHVYNWQKHFHNKTNKSSSWRFGTSYTVIAHSGWVRSLRTCIQHNVRHSQALLECMSSYPCDMMADRGLRLTSQTSFARPNFLWKIPRANWFQAVYMCWQIRHKFPFYMVKKTFDAWNLSKKFCFEESYPLLHFLHSNSPSASFLKNEACLWSNTNERSWHSIASLISQCFITSQWSE